jgi:single-strand DNA-binding protein
MIRLDVTGNLGADAEVRQHEDYNIISFSVAETKKKKDGTQITTWVSCAIWRKKDQPIRVVDYMKKGIKIFVSGTPSVSAFTDKAGNVRAELKLRVDHFELQTFADDAPKQVTPTQEPAFQQPELPGSEEKNDLPF